MQPIRLFLGESVILRLESVVKAVKFSFECFHVAERVAF